MSELQEQQNRCTSTSETVEFFHISITPRDLKRLLNKYISDVYAIPALERVSEDVEERFQLKVAVDTLRSDVNHIVQFLVNLSFTAPSNSLLIPVLFWGGLYKTSHEFEYAKYTFKLQKWNTEWAEVKKKMYRLLALRLV